MSPVTGLAQLPGRIQWGIQKRNCSPVDRNEFKKHNQNSGTQSYIVRDCHSFVDSYNITNKVNSRTLKLEIHT